MSSSISLPVNVRTLLNRKVSCVCTWRRSFGDVLDQHICGCVKAFGSGIIGCPFLEFLKKKDGKSWSFQVCEADGKVKCWTLLGWLSPDRWWGCRLTFTEGGATLVLNGGCLARNIHLPVISASHLMNPRLQQDSNKDSFMLPTNSTHYRIVLSCSWLA